MKYDQSNPLAKRVLFKNDYAEQDSAYDGFPKSRRGMTAEETLDMVSTMDRKFDRGMEESNFVPRASAPAYTCGSCRFFLRDPNSEIGSCQVVDGPIPWHGTSDHYIGAREEAAAIYRKIHEGIEETLMDAALGIEKAYESGGSSSNEEEKNIESITKKIRESNGKYQVLDSEGKKVLGTHDTRSAALRQLRAIEASKKRNLTDIESRKRIDKAQPNVNQVGLPREKGRDKKRDEEIEEMNKVDLPVPIAKIDGELQKVYGIVLEPDSVDTQGDTINAEEIEKAAEFFMRNSRIIGNSHTSVARGAELTDSFVTQSSMMLGNTPIKKGTWIIGVKIHDASLWRQVKSGEFSGFSVGGRGHRVKLR